MSSLARIIKGMIFVYIIVKLYGIIPALVIHHGSFESFSAPITLMFVIIGGIVGYFYRSRIVPVNNDMDSVSNTVPVNHFTTISSGFLKILTLFLLSPFILALLYLLYLYIGYKFFH